MSKITWDNLMNTIDDTWSYDLLGNVNDNYLVSLDMRTINDNAINESNGFRKRKHNERRHCQYEIEHDYKKYKY